MMGLSTRLYYVWAGQDLYRLIPAPIHMSGEELLKEVRSQVMSALEADFGEGADIVPIDGLVVQFAINVDKVKVER